MECKECPKTKCIDYNIGAVDKHLIIEEGKVTSEYGLVQDCKKKTKQKLKEVINDEHRV